MDGSGFDALTKRLSHRLTRRTGLGVLVGASVPLLGISVVANAKKNKKKKKVTLCANGQTVKKPKKKAKKLLNQGALKGACDTTLCGNGGPCTVFVTAAEFTVNEIGGLAGGDARCQAAAVAANLKGNYKAWLSFGSDTPGTRFSNVTRAGPYHLVPNGGDGANPPPLVATDFADVLNCPGFLSCLENPINRDEVGQPVPGDTRAWTGTMPNGVSSAFTCAGWTNSDTEQGLTGVTDFSDNRWTNNGTSLCDQARRLYCFQQAT